MKKQNKNNINKWQCKPIGNYKIELSQWAIDYRKKRRDARILVSIEHCIDRESGGNIRKT